MEEKEFEPNNNYNIIDISQHSENHYVKVEETKLQLQQRIKVYYRQLTEGCGNRLCRNPDCVSNEAIAQELRQLKKKQALQRSLKLTKVYAGQCLNEPWYQLDPENVARICNEKDLGIEYLEKVFRSNMKHCFGLGRNVGSEESNINWQLVQEFYEQIYQMEDWPELLGEMLLKVIRSIPASGDMDLFDLRKILIIFAAPTFDDSMSNLEILDALCRVVMRLNEHQHTVLVSYMYRDINLWFLERGVFILNGVTSFQWLMAEGSNGRGYSIVQPYLVLMELFFIANVRRRKEGNSFLKVAEFYNDIVNESWDLREDYVRYIESRISFVSFPFLLAPAIKSEILKVENYQQRRHEVEQAYFQHLLGRGADIPYLILEVDRNNIIHDTILQIQLQGENQLKKPLKIKFAGEPGVDEGGLRKEFFMLLVKELFDPKYGMFVHNEFSNTYWFNPDSFETVQFELIGILIGLAIYNDVILDLRFPLVAYEKLLGAKPTLEDLKFYDPELYQGFKNLLEFTGNVEETYMRTFTVEYEVFGQMKVVPLKPEGEFITLTNENREEYVERYVEYIFTTSVEDQFRHFRTGFELVCDSPVMGMFQPEELELIVCGSQVLDFGALEGSARYDGFEEDDAVVRNFWTVLHEMNEDDKRLFLTFTTGSDRAPVQGLGALRLTISRAGPDSELFPSSHTCFNHLLLPDYENLEKLREKLVYAIRHTHGFGLI